MNAVRARQARVYPRRCGGSPDHLAHGVVHLGLSPQVRGSLALPARSHSSAGSIPAGAGEPAFPCVNHLRARVYPRRCGGALGEAESAQQPPGLSPQVRGSRGLTCKTVWRNGSIPAGAGEPLSLGFGHAVPRVYPRRCGGAAKPAIPPRSNRGLSPQVRGSHLALAAGLDTEGSIPAGAGEPCSKTLPRKGRGVYPRRCGGANTAGLAFTDAAGLSPQVRGSPIPCWWRADGPGSIPAGAGEPRTGRQSLSRWGVYPRRCGGAVADGDVLRAAQGLSPQVRGSRHDRLGRIARGGSIPAGAGEPLRALLASSRRRVYPRRCGGAGYAQGLVGGDAGLSPQVRGSRKPQCRSDAAGGSIPAGAGEPCGVGAVKGAVWVYPRRCGGAHTVTPIDDPRPGLSPQVRGSPFSGAGASCSGGSIPAGAGEPRSSRWSRSGRRVYPRRCGGARIIFEPDGAAPGLSPQVRGSLALWWSMGLGPGSIPAGAGEPVCGPTGQPGSGVYPRRCGGAEISSLSPSSMSGLSPQVRGSLSPVDSAGFSAGSIPAGAGEPPIRRAPKRSPGVYPRRCGGAAFVATLT